MTTLLRPHTKCTVCERVVKLQAYRNCSHRHDPLTTLYPDTRREHHPAAALHACELRPRQCPRRFHALQHLGLERVSLLEQLVHTLRIRTLDIGQSLQISRLLARPRSQSLECECHRTHALAFPLNLFLQCARRFPAGCLLAAGLRFHLRVFRSRLLLVLGQLLLVSYPLTQLHRRHLLAHSSLRLRLILLGFLFGGHSRSLPPIGHSYSSRRAGCLKQARPVR